MAKGDYYFPLYYQKLLTSTTGWKDDEFGAYLRLLIYQYDNGAIPEDLQSIARIAPSAKRNWDLISKKFIPAEEKGFLINEVMDELRNRRLKKSITSQENGSMGGRPVAVKQGEIRFYLVECYNVGERFYKAGITDETIQSRFGSLRGQNKKMPYAFTVHLDLIIGRDHGFELEAMLRSSCERHLPLKQFGGHTECYKISEIVKAKITQYLTQNNLLGSFKETYNNMVNGYLLEIINFLKEKEENIQSENQNFFLMLILKMIDVFLKENPDYFFHKETDYAACLQISYNIAQMKHWSKHDVVNGKMNDCIDSWKTIVEFIKNDNWYSSRSLTDISTVKEWQRLVQSMKKPKNANDKGNNSSGSSGIGKHIELDKA